ncbi:MAG: type II toxin-antitoxin system VapC family toxin [Propionibacteriaceae bacterium]|jgi:predicted nucleic acid-binding protein|nr:type II toxin-antitoxin system VapC family toxin [Propionibacteriaceae bacterium]
MRLYFDTSALIKRVLAEECSGEFVAYVRQAHARGDELVTSTLGFIEVERALRAIASRGGLSGGRVITEAAGVSVSGIGELPISTSVARLARWIGSDELRTLDAIHLASAVDNHCDTMVSYDQRLLEASSGVGMAVASPGLVLSS